MRGFVDNQGQLWAPGSGRARARTRGRGGAGNKAGVPCTSTRLEPSRADAEMPSHRRSEHRGCPLSDPLLFRLDASTVSSGYPELPPTPPVSCIGGGKTVPGVRLGTTVGEATGSIHGRPCPAGDFTRSKTVVSASAMLDGWMTTRGSLLPVRGCRA